MQWIDKAFVGLRWWQPDESVAMGAIAILVVLGSGVGVWAFKRLIHQFHRERGS